MAHLWITDPDGGWAVLPLEEVPYSLARRPPRPLAADDSGREAQLVPGRSPEGTAWCVLAAGPHEVHVAGRPVPLGMRVLADRDEIRVEGVGTMFFSTEVKARVEAFPGADREHLCARCRLPVAPASLAVRCPACGVWHHQNGERECWTHTPACAMCSHPTSLDAGFRWSPEAP